MTGSIRMMDFTQLIIRILAGIISITIPVLSHASDYPVPRENVWVIKDFRFESGETIDELRVNFMTVGNPNGEPVLILHGTTGSSRSMLSPFFAGELFGVGQPLDARKYFIILPDAIGTGKTSKPSDGLRMKFPKYNYDDMVKVQHRLVSEHLNIEHLRMVMGFSMGGMHTWLWATKYPNMLDIAVPMASFPTEMSGRNWMMRRLLTESIKSDPDWQDGNYTKQPHNFQLAYLFFGVGTNGGEQALFKKAPTRILADDYLNQRLSKTFDADANDYIYQWDSSRDYNASPNLGAIKAYVLAVNSDDDERNPRSLKIMEREMKKVKNGREVVIRGSEETWGHGTVLQAHRWKEELDSVLKSAPAIYSGD